MRDMDLKLLTEVGKILPDPEPETQTADDNRSVETKRRTKK